MSKVQQIEATIESLKPSPEELRQLRDWLEDGCDFTEAFEAAIRRSDADMFAGESTRTRGGERR